MTILTVNSLRAFLFGSAILTLAASAAAQSFVTPEVQERMTQHACPELPSGPLSDDEIDALVADDAPGHVRVQWKLESQENTYGFNIYRKSAEGNDEYAKVNPWLIPGDGTTNIPKVYCYNDIPTTRGATFLYYIEEIAQDGTSTVIEGTMDTKVKVKSVAEERDWLRKKINGVQASSAATTATQTVNTTTSATAQVTTETKTN